MTTPQELALTGKKRNNTKLDEDISALVQPRENATDYPHNDILLTATHGFCMALADSVPGVSGGTIAFILGFYERLLSAIQGVAGSNKALRRQSLRYLGKLGIRWALGMIAANLVLVQVFENHVHFMSSLFLGLTVVSIPLVIHSEYTVLKRKPISVLFVLPGIAAVVGLVAVRNSAVPWIAVNYLRLSPDSMLYLFLSGALAVCAMVLPGISGSTLLMVFGVYLPTIYALRQVLALQFSYLPALLLLAAGAVTGLLLFIRTLRGALTRYRAEMLYLVLGLMVGSLYAIWMGPTTLPIPQDALSIGTFNIWAFLIGGAVLVGLERLQARVGR